MAQFISAGFSGGFSLFIPLKGIRSRAPARRRRSSRVLFLCPFHLLYMQRGRKYILVSCYSASEERTDMYLVTDSSINDGSSSIGLSILFIMGFAIVRM